MNPDKRLFVRSVLFQVLNVFVTGGIGLVLVPLYVRNVGVERYGVLELILSLLLINLFLEFGLGSTVVKFSREYAQKGPDEYRSFFWTYLWIKTGLGLIGALVVFGLSFIFTDLFVSVPVEYAAEAQASLWIFSLGLFVSNVSVFLANCLKGFLRFDLAISSAIVSWIALLSSLLLAGRTRALRLPEISLLVFFLRPVVQFVFAGVAFVMVSPHRVGISKPSRAVMRSTGRFMGGFSAITLVAQGFNRLPKMILGVIGGPASLAFFGVLEKLREPVAQIQDSILRPLMPAMRREHFEDPDKIADVVRRIVSIQSVVSAIAMAGVLFTYPFIRLWLGEAFSEVSIVARVWMIPFVLPSAGALTMIYYASGKTRLSLIFVAFTALLGLGGGTILAVFIGWEGMAYGIVGALCIVQLSRLVVFSRHFSVSLVTVVAPYAKTYLITVPLAIVYFAIGADAIISNWAVLIAGCAIYVAAYLAVSIPLQFKGELRTMLAEIRSSRVAT